MNEIFISYSRRNKELTQKLFTAFEEAGRSVWTDWDDIPASSDWEAEIKDGIRKADSVVFVLSSEWIKSNECRKELSYSVEMGKRMFPVLLENIDAKEVPPELAKINWIYMREGDDFDKAFQSLCSAFDTDLTWVKLHTRIQVRALEWDQKQRDHSFVLRGKDLEEAELFLSQSTGKSPEPTNLQKEYILASRKDATQRQRLTLIGVTTALAISIVLGVVAIFQWQAAVLNAKLSSARELAAASLYNLEVDPERSLLLALQSVDIIHTTNQPIPPESEYALRRALQMSRLRFSLNDDSTSVLGLTFSPDGRFLAASSLDGTVKIWDVSNPAAGFFSGQPKLTLSGFATSVTSLAFSPDGTRLVTGNYENTAIIWDAESGDKLLTLSGHTERINKVKFSPDGQLIGTASSDGTAKIWDANTGELKFDLSGNTGEIINSIAFSADGNLIASGGGDGVILWDAVDGTQLSIFDEGCSIVDLAFSPNGRLIATADNCLQSVIWDLLSGEVVSKNKDHTDIVSAISFSPDGSLVASASRDNTAIILDTYTNQSKFTLNDSSDITALAFSPDGTLIITGNMDGQLKLWDANPVTDYETMGFQPHTARIDGMEFNPDNDHFVSSSWDGTAFIWSLTGESPIELIGHQSQVRDITISTDGKKIITGGYDGTAIIWDAATGAQIRTLSHNSQNITAVTFSPDGTLAVGGTEENVVLVWDAATGEEIVSLQSADQYFIDEVAFSPNGTTLAVASDSGKVIIWDVATWVQKFTLEGHTDWVKGVAFSPDGNYIVTASYDTTAIMWNAENGEKLFSLVGHAQGINDVAFSPDGRIIATASVDRSAKIWDAGTGEIVTTLSSSEPILSVVFNPDGNFLATGSETGVIRFYFVHFEDVLALARERITRTLTEQECQTYLHEITCPNTIIKP